MKREEGVVAVVVALCLVVLMGGVALTLDVGSLLYRRREMVNGADAAALAAAMECARDKGIGAATAAANDQFEGNSPGSKNGYTLNTIVASPTCGGTAGHVTVSYTSPQPLYFAPVLGMSDHRDVTTEATASWGPGGPFPIAVNLGPPNAFKTCSINATPGTDCYYLFDNNQNGNGDFGFLNLAQWGATSDQQCNGGGGREPHRRRDHRDRRLLAVRLRCPQTGLPDQRAQGQGLEPGVGLDGWPDSLVPHQRSFPDDRQALVHRGFRADDDPQR